MPSALRTAILLMGISASIAGAQQYDLRVFSLGDGLPGASVHAFQEDPDGFLWMGTSAGICRTDGRHFRTYDRRSGLRDDAVNAVLRDPSGTLWVGLGRGVMRRDQGRFVEAGPEALRDAEITGMLVDAQDRLWVSSRTMGTWRATTPEAAAWEPITELAGLRVNGMARMGTSIWSATDKGVMLCEEGRTRLLPVTAGAEATTVFADSTCLMVGSREGAWILAEGLTHRLDTINVLPTNRVQSLLRGRHGAIWIGTPMGLVMLERGLNDLTNARTLTTRNGLGNNDIRSLYQDRSGAVWIGTEYGGASKFVSLAFIHFTDRDGLGSRIVSAVQRTRDGDVWIGTYGGGVAHFDGEVLTRYGPDEGLVDPFVLSLTCDSTGRVIVGTKHEGAFVLRNDRFVNLGTRRTSDRSTNFLITDEEGRIWAGTSDGLLCAPGDGEVVRMPLSAPVNAVAPAGDTVWIASAAGLLYLDTRRVPWEPMPIPVAPAHTYTSLVRDGMGNLWCGSEGHGLFRLSGTRLDSLTLTGGMGSAQGLGNAYVEQVLLDEVQNLWIGTRLGLDHVMLDELQENVIDIDHYGAEEGFAGVETFRNACLLDPLDSSLWFGTVQGLTRYQPDYVLRDPNEPSTRLTGLELFYEEVDWSPWCDRVDTQGLPRGLVLPHNKNQLTFSFVGVSLAYPEKVRYQYFLDGYDPDWSPITEQDRVTYSNLQPGEYTFQVIARNASGVWNQEPFRFGFTVEPPIWRTTGFQAAAGGAGILLVLGFVQLRTRKLRRDRERLEGMVRERTSELAEEKHRSERLLLNILPESTALELREHGQAQAHSYPSCTVLFSDFQGFTRFSAELGDTRLVSDLDRFFRAFDRLTDRFGIEKIKTIGDAYMCAAGLPEEHPQHALAMVLMALAMLDEADRVNRERAREGLAEWPIRIGIHTGPVIAGVVGEKKFAYDVWGDTVNLASRMESNGAPGRINLSGATYAGVMEYVQCTPRGPLQVKNKGEMQMYFLDRLRPAFSTDRSGRVPNAGLLDLLGNPTP